MRKTDEQLWVKCENCRKPIFKKSFEEIYKDTRKYFSETAPKTIEEAEKNPKLKMALIFRWYLWHTNLLAIQGVVDQKVDFQIHCSPAMGAFNQWVKGTKYEDWHSRHVDEIADLLMNGAVNVLKERFLIFQGSQ